MNRTVRLIGAVAIVSFLLGARILWDFLDTNSIPQQSIQYQLQMIGSSIYEFHARTGRWPAQLDDLAATSLQQRSYNWRLWLPPFVILWRSDLKPDPKDNATIVLAYHNAGLLAEMGRKWVLWGDLRTEYVKTSRLQTILDEQNKGNKIP